MLAVIFIRRRLYLELPFFFSYITAALLVGLVRYIAFHTGRAAYFYSYWVSDLAISMIALLSIYEVFMRRLFPGFRKTRFYRKLFALAALAILLVAVVTAMQVPDKGAAFQMVSRAFDFVRTAVISFFIILMLFMGRQWTRYNLGISAGFGIQAAVALANAAIRTRVQYRATVFDTVAFLTYDVACVIWLITFMKPEVPATPTATDTLSHQALHEARKWESSLKDWLTPGKK